MRSNYSEDSPSTFSDSSITIIEAFLPPSIIWQGEKGLKALIIKKPSLVAKGMKVIGEEIRIFKGSVDLVGDDGEFLYIIELKVASKHHAVAMLKRQGVEQLQRYYSYFLTLCKLLGSNKPVKLVLVIGIEDPESRRVRKYVVDGDREVLIQDLDRSVAIVSLEEELEERVEKVLDEATKIQLLDLKRKISDMKDELERLRREREKLKYSLDRVKKVKWGERLLFLIAKLHGVKPDRCLLCDAPSDIILRVDGKDYGLCGECWDYLVQLEKDRLKPKD